LIELHRKTSAQCDALKEVRCAVSKALEALERIENFIGVLVLMQCLQTIHSDLLFQHSFFCAIAAPAGERKAEIVIPVFNFTRNALCVRSFAAPTA
jgi:hypothetical protein